MPPEQRIRVVDKETGAESYVPATEYDPTSQELVEGQVLTVDPLDEGGAYAAGQTVTEEVLTGRALLGDVSPESRARLTRERVTDEQFGGGIGEQLLRGALAEFTLGASELALREADPFAREREARKREAGRGAFTAGQVIGGVAGALVPGSLAAGAGRLARGGIRGAALEGALSGAGAAVAELAIDENPITIEHAASAISSNALLGAGLGAGTSTLGYAAERGLLRARQALAKARAAPAQALDGGAHADALRAYRAETDAVNPWLVVEGEERAVLTKAKRSTRRLLDEPIGYEESPWKALDPLRREAQALRKTIDKGDEIAERLAREDVEIAAKIMADLGDADDVLLKGKAATRYAAHTGTKASARKGVTVPREDALTFQAALATGEVQGARAQALGGLQGALDRNEALQAQITAAREASRKGPETGIEKATRTYAVGAALGVLPGGPVGMLAAPAIRGAVEKAVKAVRGRLGQTATASMGRTSAAVDRFLDIARPAPRVAAVAAAKILGAVAYGPRDDRRAPSTGSKLGNTYRAREGEIREQVTTDPAGRATITPAARRAIAERLAGAFAASPQLGDSLEALAVRRLEFLASRLPRRPDFGTPQIGPDRWMPSAQDVAKFARYAAAVEDPDAIVERLGDGSLTIEDAEVLREVYPERYADLQRALVERLPELRANLPYERRLSLSILFGVPVDPTMSRSVVAMLQGNFRAEQGTEGGTQAPRAKPAFGSLTRPDPTPAQERAG